jgi:hypothetical protein
VGSRSAIDKLPPDLRQRLIELLQDPNVTHQAVADIINAEAGDSVTSRSAVNRYAQKMARWSEKNRQAREVAEAYSAAVDTRNTMGKVLNEQIRMLAFDLMTDLEDLRNDPDKALNSGAMSALILNLSKSVKELEQAEKLNAERAASIRQEALAEAAKAMEQTAKEKGLSADTIDLFKRKILGL